MQTVVNDPITLLTTSGQDNNAETATAYATFWIEKVSHASFPTFIQLQYAQMVVLNFAIFSVLGAPYPG